MLECMPTGEDPTMVAFNGPLPTDLWIGRRIHISGYLSLRPLNALCASTLPLPPTRSALEAGSDPMGYQDCRQNNNISAGACCSSNQLDSFPLVHLTYPIPWDGGTPVTIL